MEIGKQQSEIKMGPKEDGDMQAAKRDCNA